LKSQKVSNSTSEILSETKEKSLSKSSASNNTNQPKKRSLDKLLPASSASGSSNIGNPLEMKTILENNTKKPKTIQEDPNASDVFKSLFNTCDKAKNQTKAHWVTFNPQYF
jgi:hypothetical protein